MNIENNLDIALENLDTAIDNIAEEGILFASTIGLLGLGLLATPIFTKIENSATKKSLELWNKLSNNEKEKIINDAKIICFNYMKNKYDKIFNKTFNKKLSLSDISEFNIHEFYKDPSLKNNSIDMKYKNIFVKNNIVQIIFALKNDYIQKLLEKDIYLDYSTKDLRNVLYVSYDIRNKKLENVYGFDLIVDKKLEKILDK